MTDLSLAAALAKLQEDLPEVAKTLTATVKGKTRDGTPISYNYGYADLSIVTQAILPRLAELGLSWVTRPTVNAAGKFVLTYKLQNSTGESEEGEWPLPTGSPQEMGSAVTYARRYCLCAVTGLAPKGDDDDAEKTTRAATRRRGAQALRPEPDPDDPGPTELAAGSNAAPAIPGITAAQMRNLQRRFGIMFGRDRDAKLEYAVEVVGRELTSSSELTKDEAHRVIDHLGQEPVVVEHEAANPPPGAKS